MTDIPLAPIGGAPQRDSNERPLGGVVATLRSLDAETVCLAFDDVESSTSTRDKSWRYRVFYTHAAYPTQKAQEMALTDEQYRDIGITLMARLVAIHESKNKS